MALALGLGHSNRLLWGIALTTFCYLGSLFNHSDPPNVTYSLDIKNDCIRYTTSRDIREGEELCIFYGHSLWFTPAKSSSQSCSEPEATDDGWGGLTAVGDDQPDEIMDISNPYTDGDPEGIICEEDLPFIRLKPAPEEEDAQSIQTGSCLFLRDESTELIWLSSPCMGRRRTRSTFHYNTPQVCTPFAFESAHSNFKPQDG